MLGPFHVAVVAIVAGCFLVAFLARRPKGNLKEMQALIEQQEAQIKQLTERVEVLEKVVTDDDYNLKQQINRL